MRAEKSNEVMYDVEHKELFESIRQGQPINNGNYMVLSSMLAILAQMVCYTGEEITWEQVLTSRSTSPCRRTRGMLSHL